MNIGKAIDTAKTTAPVPRLIIVDGPSTVGKSSISKSVYKQLAEHLPAYWLHEECQHHPIIEGEFEAGDIHAAEGMEQNRAAMLRKWTAFRDSLLADSRICITEGCFFHTIDRYLLESVWTTEQICDYFHQVIDILEPLHPLIVFVYRSELRKSFEEAFAARGEWWKDLIMGVPEPYGYFETHAYTGADSVFAGCAYEQELMATVYEAIQCNKLKLDTGAKEWDYYTAQIVKRCGYRYEKPVVPTIQAQRYTGIYQQEDGKSIWTISYDPGKGLYSSLFWPYMPMTCTDEATLELLSFPVTLHFSEQNGQSSFLVEGNYDWDYNGKRFIRTEQTG